MPVPDFQSLTLPLLKFASEGNEHTLTEAIQSLGDEFRLSDAERAELLPSGKQSRFSNRVGWARTYLVKAGLLRSVGRGRFAITERGRTVLASPPSVISVRFLEERFPELAEFTSGTATDDGDDGDVFDPVGNTWLLRAPVLERIREKIERALPDPQVRAKVLELLAFAVENADEERPDGWQIREIARGVQLMTGRLLAFRLARSKCRMSVLGPVSDEVRAAVGAEAEDDEDFKWIPGASILTFPVEHAGAALELLQPHFNGFVDEAMARLRTTPANLKWHTPEAVAYVSEELGRELPQPELDHPTSASSVEDENNDDAPVDRAPQVRGRPPIFEHAQRAIGSLVEDIERGAIALPELQRPFVWEDTKVRDLLDSLFVGFPVGTLVLWHTSTEKDARALGRDRPSLRATQLVIDGQQRLTSLFAVMRGAEVIAKDGRKRRITIAFRPRDGRFEVADAAIRNDPEYLANVTELWSGTRSKPQIRRDLLNALRDKGRAVDDAYEDAVERNLDRAHAVADYRFPTVDIRKTASKHDEEANEEDVAEIFVRINNQGSRLNQADFVLTLLSVFHGDLRDEIEESARTMSDGAVVAIDTQQLLRTACAVAFGRARMAAMYRYLRGVDPDSGDADPDGRLSRLEQLDAAAKQCIHSTLWRDYQLRVKHAGFVSSALVASKNAVVNAYAFYVRGRRVGVAKPTLDELVSRWLFASLVTARYSGASETAFERDLARVAGADPEGFVRTLDHAMSEVLTGDFWTHTLVSALETQRGRAPAALAFRAAQIVLGARGLFSDQLLQNLLDPPGDAARSASETHHLFPKAWLQSQGIRDRRLVNQVANLADAGWYENNVIGARSPAAYVPRLREMLNIDDARWGRVCAEHALPPGWEAMDYDTFLRERRPRMADIIRVAFRKLGGENEAPLLEPPWFLPGAALVWQRITQAERALRSLVREVYVARYGANAPQAIEGALPEQGREALARALRSRPVGSDPLSIVDYLYLAQLPPLLFRGEVWQEARGRMSAGQDVKQRLDAALRAIAPVRNEIAHVREVPPERLQRASVACADVLELVGQRSGS